MSEAATLPRGNVLIVDDEPLIVSIVRRVLSTEHEVTTVLSGAGALAELEAGKTFDAVVCDLMMPDMTGMELFAELEQRAPLLATRVIFLTGGAFTASARAFLESVENPHMEKPFNMSSLRALVHRVVAASYADRAVR